MALSLPVTLLRYRRQLTVCAYAIALVLSLYVLYDPEAVVNLIRSSRTQLSAADVSNVPANEPNDDQLYSLMGADFKPLPKPTPKTAVYLPFLPKTHECESMFEKAGHQFKYSEFYWEHSDAYKGALSMAGIMKEANVDEVSWIFHEIGMMPFVETVCETGFRAGHYSFHWLTAKPDITVHSFESKQFNFTEAIATFMTAEFPDRFYFYLGATSKTLRAFKRQNNDTKCDLIYLDSDHKNQQEIDEDFVNLSAIKVPDKNLIVTLSYDHGEVDMAAEWSKRVKSGEILEHFSCTFNPSNATTIGYDMSSRNDLRVRAIYVGTVTNAKENKK